MSVANMEMEDLACDMGLEGEVLIHRLGKA